MIDITENMDADCDDQQDPTKCNPPKDSKGKKRRAFVKKAKSKPKPTPPEDVDPQDRPFNVRTLGDSYTMGDPNKAQQSGDIPSRRTKRLWKRP